MSGNKGNGYGSGQTSWMNDLSVKYISFAYLNQRRIV